MNYRRRTDVSSGFLRRLSEILFESDLTIASFLLGTGLCIWGAIAVTLSPIDVVDYNNIHDTTAWIFWTLNYQIAGIGFIYVAWKNFPSTVSLLVGSHAAILWTWIASIRGLSASFSSGITLTYLVIIIGILLIQRSRQP